MELIDDIMSTTYDPLLPSNASQREEIKKFAASQVNVIIQSCNNAEYYAALEKMEAVTDSLPMFDKPVKYPTGKYTIVVGIPLLVTMQPLFEQAKEINAEII